MFKTLRYISVIVGFLISTSLLRGAGIGFPLAYAAPESLSRFLISTIVVIATIRFIYLIFDFFKPKILR